MQKTGRSALNVILLAGYEFTRKQLELTQRQTEGAAVKQAGEVFSGIEEQKGTGQSSLLYIVENHHQQGNIMLFTPHLTNETTRFAGHYHPDWTKPLVQIPKESSFNIYRQG